ncbi:MAG: transporter [Eggerthellaceae bacterium]|nr:transporter [Eggerthellaceae bacterium]
MGKGLNKRALALIALHVLLLVYSSTSFFSKNAAQQEFLSPAFIGFYIGMIVVLGIYAVGWQQVIKHLPLTLAFANKAVTVAWGMFWSVCFFHEAITAQMIVGAIIVMAGVALFSYADAREQQEATAPGGDA